MMVTISVSDSSLIDEMVNGRDDGCKKSVGVWGILWNTLILWH